MTLFDYANKDKKIVHLAWGRKSRHIAIDGKVLCGCGVELPKYEKTDNDKSSCNSDGIIPFKPISEQPKVIDPRYLCGKCLVRYNEVV